jgi:hypothetical protein
LSTQVVSAWNGAGLGIGSGGPKKQFASSAQEPAEPPQFPSPVHEGSELLLTQCRPGPAPTVQFLELVPGLAPSVDDPVICRSDPAPSGILPPATTPAFPAPK